MDSAPLCPPAASGCDVVVELVTKVVVTVTGADVDMEGAGVRVPVKVETPVGVSVPVRVDVTAAVFNSVGRSIPYLEAADSRAVGCMVGPNADVNEFTIAVAANGGMPEGRGNAVAVMPGITTPGGRVNVF